MTRLKLLKLIFPNPNDITNESNENLKLDMQEFDFRFKTLEQIYELGFEAGVMTALNKLKDKVEEKK